MIGVPVHERHAAAGGMAPLGGVPAVSREGRLAVALSLGSVAFAVSDIEGRFRCPEQSCHRALEAFGNTVHLLAVACG
jgi:hypothetical protein